MTPLRRLLRRYGDATARIDASAVRRRLDAASDTSLLRDLPPVPREAVDRVRSRVDATLERRRPARRPAPLLILGGAMAVVAVALAWPRDPRVEAVLTAAATSAPTPEVHLAWDGEGALSGTRYAPRIAWSRGQVEVEVEPERDVDLVVETPEAMITVVGTVFTVTRDRLGTRVDVSRGTVDVVCQGLEPVRVTAGGSTTCLPVRGAELLGRARLLQAQGASGTDVLDTIERGLERQASGPIRSELLALEVAQLASAGRDREALDKADEYLASGDPLRRSDVRRLAARIALREHGCARALAYLEAQISEDPSEEDRAAAAACGGR
jgi:hypothetical protein